MQVLGSIALSLAARAALRWWLRLRSYSACARSLFGIIFVMTSKTIPRRDLGSCGQGTLHWWQQRVSAMALVPLLIWFLVEVLSVHVADPLSVVRWMRGGVHALLLIALVLAATQHSYLGTRVIAEDYVSGLKARVATLVMLQWMHLVLAGAGVLSVLRVALGAAP